MFTEFPARLARRIAVVAAVATTALAALAIGGSASARAASFTTVDTPYYHTDSIGRRWIYGHAYEGGCGVYGKLVKATVAQYYGGAWHTVGTGQASTTGGSCANASAVGAVLCTSPYTPYTFMAEADGWYQWFSGGSWTYDGFVRKTTTLYC